ncbi:MULTISPECIES: ribose 5-phosphate isomerase B [Flammeovirga]|uniref:Ribose 5-phosphate isomerase B n=1 Tax=Flammeovirga aprica JL-4 TaxID=694437 RepID=A0A7X9RVX1_9BACT|nr:MULTISPECIES: ribose 5-phosphate isomerase B [Flammeovirga]KXX72692.1 ribose-5-phosphate isomerase [Flammeovirga sp. SJP92]MBD0400093.1 ribose 5-phosphate isomerase B [Flammeovirga sp. EKP202]NME69711.1 ribose 5-phosphate isomerase B [Flammeovirga aprica JL-4]
MKLAIGGDHAGFEYKAEIIKHLEANGHEVKDFGPFSTASCDYPDYVHPLAEAVENGEYEFGITICGSGIGVSIVANKHKGIRAGLCWEPVLAQLTRQHNNSNVVSIPARFISLVRAIEIVDTFISTEFEGGRHQNRVDKIPV